MKKLRILGILVIILAILVIAVPSAVSAGIYTSKFTITKGIEVFPGIAIGIDKYGATFVAGVAGTDGALSGDTGALSASINYVGPNPDPTNGNHIFGGSWTLTVTKGFYVLGTIYGKVPDGNVTWSMVNSNPTGDGAVNLNLSITGGTAQFATIKKGTGSWFAGDDIHESGYYLGTTEVPFVTGNLYLVY